MGFELSDRLIYGLSGNGCFWAAFYFTQKAEAAEHREAYSLNDEYPSNDCLETSLIGYE